MSLFKLFISSFVFFFAVLGLLSVGAHDLSLSDLSPLLSLAVFAGLQATVLIVLERIGRSHRQGGHLAH